jgi:hypothetical protein
LLCLSKEEACIRRWQNKAAAARVQLCSTTRHADMAEHHLSELDGPSPVRSDVDPVEGIWSVTEY